jgi:hypothetical protein
MDNKKYTQHFVGGISWYVAIWKAETEIWKKINICGRETRCAYVNCIELGYGRVQWRVLLLGYIC